jgi:hypothetical protein
MHVHAAFLAIDARIRNGLVYAVGGFPDSWTVPSLPTISRLTVVVVFEPASDEGPDGSADVGVELWHDMNGVQVATAHVTFAGTYEPVSGAPNFRSVVIPFDVHLRHVGPHEIRLTRCGARIAKIGFSVRIGSSTT